MTADGETVAVRTDEPTTLVCSLRSAGRARAAALGDPVPAVAVTVRARRRRG